jgi:hypothetical protein
LLKQQQEKEAAKELEGKGNRDIALTRVGEGISQFSISNSNEAEKRTPPRIAESDHTMGP